jgi:hypothetical protein
MHTVLTILTNNPYYSLTNIIMLYNSFYFNQHMHYNFVVIYTPTYVSTTY